MNRISFVPHNESSNHNSGELIDIVEMVVNVVEPDKDNLDNLLNITSNMQVPAVNTKKIFFYICVCECVFGYVCVCLC